MLPFTADDAALIEAMELDSVVMRHLGGPTPREKLAGVTARRERYARVVHALPSVENLASNAICRKLGFTLVGPAMAGYNAGPVPSNDWVIELWPR